MVSSPPVPLSLHTVPGAMYELGADARRQDVKRIFCVEGSFGITNQEGA